MITYFNLHQPEDERLLADSWGHEEQEVKHCPVTSEHLDGRRRTTPLSLRVKHSCHEEEIIWAWVEGCVVHQRVLDQFEKHGFTGYRTRPATVRFRDRSSSNEYLELIVTGWAGVVDPGSGVRVMKSCPACHWKQYTGIKNYENLIDWTQWTGDDFFMVWPLPRFTLITERVAMLLLESGIKSFTLKALDDFERPVGASGFTVGRLSNFLPEDLAIKYGRALDLE